MSIPSVTFAQHSIARGSSANVAGWAQLEFEPDHMIKIFPFYQAAENGRTTGRVGDSGRLRSYSTWNNEHRQKEKSKQQAASAKHPN